MRLEHIEFFKTAIIKQHFNPFAGCHPAFGMLLVNTLLTTSQAGKSPHFHQLVKIVAHIFSPAPFANTTLNATGHQLFFEQNSINTPWVDLGCRNATSLPPAPSIGVSWIRRQPPSRACLIWPAISSVLYATW